MLAPMPTAATPDALEKVASIPRWPELRVDRATMELWAV